MLRRLAVAVFALAVCAAVGHAQLVVSARSGLIHHVVGEVLLDGERVAGVWGGLSYVSPGSTLETEQGQAELLLAPGIVLRLGPESSIRMRADDITAVQLEFLKGTAIVDWQSAMKERAVTIAYAGTAVRFDGKGLYRMQADAGYPFNLRVSHGRAVIVKNKVETVVRGGQQARLETDGLVLRDAAPCDNDEFDEWSLSRASRIAELNSAGQAPGDEVLRGLRSLARALAAESDTSARPPSASDRLRNGALRGKLR